MTYEEITVLFLATLTTSRSQTLLNRLNGIAPCPFGSVRHCGQA